MTEDLQYRLYNTSITPPGDAWPKIVEQLDKEAQEKLSLKMQQATLAPPADAWLNILGSLNEADTPIHETKVISITRRRSWLAAAAIAAGIIVLAGLFYFMSGEKNVDTAGKAQPSGSNSSTAKNSDAGTSSTNNQSNTTEPRDKVVASTGSTATLAILSHNARPQRVRYARVKKNAVAENYQYASNTDGAFEEPVSVEPKTYITPKAYLTVAAPNGQPAKISAKFADAVGYILNNEPADNMSSALKSISWKRRFSNWSNKLMMSPAFIPSATNFFDIIELEELLKE